MGVCCCKCCSRNAINERNAESGDVVVAILFGLPFIGPLTKLIMEEEFGVVEVGVGDSERDCHGLPGDSLSEFEEELDELELWEMGPML